MARPTPVPDWVPTDLPRKPGVYHFTDRTGVTLYVGKSVNLRRRVRGYFYGSGPSDSRLAEMLRIARGVRVRHTGTDLEARLVETEAILRDRPPYNRAVKRRWRGWYLEIDWSDPFPRLGITRATRKTAARYFGPFWGRRIPVEIQRLAEKICRLRSCAEPVRPDPGGSACLQRELGLCTAPCVKAVGLDEYRAQVRLAAKLLASRREAVRLRERVAAARRRATAELAFEQAAHEQARLDWLDALEQYRFALEPDAGLRSWLIVLPAALEEERVLVPVARGKVLERRAVPWSDGHWMSAVEDTCYAVRVGELRASSVFPPEELAPSLLVTRWLQRGAPDGRAFDLGRHTAPEVIARLARC